MIRTTLWTIVQIIAITSFGQPNINVSGIVNDPVDNAEISNAAVAISGISIGTTTDQHGRFSLSITPDHAKDSITISCIGYEPKKIMVADMKPAENIFSLRRRNYSYREVTISPHQKREITAQMIEKMMAKISDTFYMSKYETSLYLYKAFLDEACRSGGAVCDEAEFKYNDNYSKSLFNYFNYEQQVAFLNWDDPRVERFPVSDITYDAALEFCKWLTGKYSEFNKRKFKNATFRLPSSDEWAYAAQGGAKEKTRFPWRGDLPYFYPPLDTVRRYYVHYKGCCDDTARGIVMGSGPVDRGYANRFGLLNVCGNVSEMVIEKGIYKGGCTMDKIENIGIYAPQAPSRKDPDFFIGFRVAMVVKKQ